jgi:hypothetical protein
VPRPGGIEGQSDGGKDLPAEILFSDVELRTLRAYAQKKLKQSFLLGEAITLVARIGGYLNRSTDPPPGHQTIWRGYSVLQLMCEGFSLQNHGAVV